jgi:flavorubredoxin
MLTYLQEDQILFPCDLFGSHLATTDLYGKEDGRLYDAAKRYYAEIMMPFRKIIAGHLKKLESYQFSLIAPSHGPIYANPDFILDAYDEWVNGEPKNAVVLPYISMHGSTEKMVDHLLDELVARGVKVYRFNMEHTALGDLAMTLVDSATLVVATPTFLTGAHPKIIYPVYIANAIRPKTKFISVIGSYGWGGKTAKQLTEMTSLIKAEQLDPVLIKGDPTEEDYAALDRLADQIAEKHASLGE